MSSFGKNLKQLRLQNKQTQIELAQAIGLSFSAISMYERGERKPDFETLEIIADYFNVTIDGLIGGDREDANVKNILPIPKFNRIPLLGTIACGEPILAQENVEGDVDIPEQIRADFALRCKGDSMIDARICDGDIVYIKQQPTVENGQIGAVLIGDEATLKKVYITEGTVTLMACNTNYAPLVYSGDKLNEIRILGKAVGFTSCVI